MYPHQIERLTSALDAAAGEALVATSAANVAYVTGFRSLTHAMLHAPQFGVFTRRGTALVVPAADVAAAVDDGVDVDHVQCFGEPLASSGELAGPLRAARAGDREPARPDGRRGPGRGPGRAGGSRGRGRARRGAPARGRPSADRGATGPSPGRARARPISARRGG